MKESSFMKKIDTKKSIILSLIVLLCFGIGVLSTCNFTTSKSSKVI